MVLLSVQGWHKLPALTAVLQLLCADGGIGGGGRRQLFQQEKDSGDSKMKQSQGEIKKKNILQICQVFPNFRFLVVT